MFLDAEQIDTVDESKIPASSPDPDKITF